MTKILKPDRVYRLWESATYLLDYSEWLPEVVGSEEELRHSGSILVTRLPDGYKGESLIVDIPEEELRPVRFVDSDVSKYRKLLEMFRFRHRTT